MEKEPNKLDGITDEQRSAIIREHLRTAGRKGGKTMKKRGRKYFQEIGKKGALARWKNKQS